MDWIHYVVAVLFVLLGAGCVGLVILQAPGTWIMLAIAVVVELVDSAYSTAADPQTFSWWVLGVAAVLAIIGEVVEFLSSAAGAKAGGGTRRGVIGAIIGGIVGLFVFTPVFFFIPIFGSLLGAILGTFIGAVIGEMTGQDKSLRGSLRPASGAAVGRIVATIAKTGIAVVIWLFLSVAIFL
jgi:hypothetical protein